MANLAAVLRILAQADTSQAQRRIKDFDRQVSETRAKTEKAIKAQLGADFNPAAFAAYDAALARTEKRVSNKAAFKAALGGDFDAKAFGAYQRELTKIENANNRTAQSSHSFGRSLTANARSTRTELQALGNAMGTLAKESAVISAVGIAAQAVSALGAAATATTAGLSPLAGALAAYPALASAGAQALGTWKLAFDGVKTAVGGINQQLDKNSKAFRELTPEGKKFAEVLEGMKGPLRDLSQTAQANLMPGLAEGLKSAQANFGIFNRGIAGASKAIGDLARRAGELVGSKGFGADLDTQMKANNVTITRLGQAGLYLADALRHVILAAGPLVDWITRTTVRLAQQVDAWAAAGRESGKFTQFFEQTRRVMTEVGHIAANLAVALVNIFRGAYPTGQSLLQILEGLSKRFREWTGSAQGQNAIQRFFEQQKPAMIEAGRLLGAIVQAFGRLGSGTQVAPLLATIRTQLLPAFEKLVQNTTASFGPAFIEALKNVMLIFAQLGGSSGPLVATVTVFGKLAASVNWLLSHIPGLAPIIVGAFVTARIVAFGNALGDATKKYLGLLAVSQKPIAPRLAAVPAAATGAAAAASGAAGATATTATTATTAEAAFGGAALAKLRAVGTVAMRGLGVALGGVLATQIAAAVVPGAAKAISAIGMGAAAGGAIGSVIPGVGTAVGAAIGAGLGGAIALFKSHATADGADWARRFSAGISINIPPAQAAQIQAQMSRLFSSFESAGAHLRETMRQAADIGISPQQLNAAQARLNAAAANLGRTAAQQFAVGWNATPLKGTSAFIQSALFQLQQLPAQARQQAAQTMIQYAQQLVASGQLPKSAVGQMIAGIKAQFPGLTAYFRQQGLASDRALAVAMALQQARGTLTTSLQGIQRQFGLTWIQVRNSASGLPRSFAQTWEALIALSRDKSPLVRKAAVDQLNQMQRQGTAAFGTLSRSSGAILDQLRADTKTKTGAARDAAVTAYNQMRSRMRASLDNLAGHTWQKMEEAKRAVGRRSGEARDAGSTAFMQLAKNIGTAVNAGAISTQEGAQIIAKTLNKQLKAFGVAPIAGAAITGITQVTQGVKGVLGIGKQGGGYLGRPGAVGPDSIPIMAAPGEAVLNRHQQKYVNSALQQTYGTNLPGLFSKVKTPHAMQKGGIAGWRNVTASAEDDVGKKGYRGNTISPYGYSELSIPPSSLSFNALGNLPYMTPMRIRSGGHQVVAGKQDVGAGSSFNPAMGLYPGTVAQLGLSGGQFRVQIERADGVPLTAGGAAGVAQALQAWSNIATPKVKGKGTVAEIVRAALGKITDAANAYGQAHMPLPSAATGGGPGTLPPGASQQDIQKAMMAAAAHIMGRPYIFGGGHGAWESPGYDCSGAVSYVLHAAGLLGSPMDTVAGRSWGVLGPGKYVTVGIRGGAGASGHMMMSFFGKFLESGGGGPYGAGKVHWDPGWDGAFDFRHPYGLAQGGVVGDFGEVSPSVLLQGNPALAQMPAFLAYQNAKKMGAGGFIKMATGGAPLAGKAPAKGKAIPPAWRGKGYDKPGWQGVKGDPRPAREKLSPGWGYMPTGGAGIGPSQLQQVAASAGKAEKIIGQGGPFPFGEGDIASISAMLSRLDKLEGIGSGQLGGGDIGKQSSLIQWFENSFWSSGLFPDPNFSSWNTPANFVISQDAAGNQITPYVSPHIDQVVQQLGQSLGWFNTIVADHQAAVATVNALLPRIQKAIDRRVAVIAKIRARITQNLKRISDLQAKVKAEQARKLPYAKPKNNAQKAANTAFDRARKQRIDAWNKQIGGIQDENKVLTGAKDRAGTTGELAALSAELGTRPGGLLASYMGGSSASGLYQLQQSARDWVGQISAVGGLLDQAKLDRDLRANGLAALKPGASAAAASAAAQQASATAATAATDNSQLLALLQDWKTSQARETAVAAAQAAVLSQPLVGAFASGGTVPRTGFALVGEQGPELAALPQGTRVYSNATTNNIMQGGGGHDVHLHFAPGTEWLRQFVDVRVEQKTRKAAGNRAPLPGARG